MDGPFEARHRHGSEKCKDALLTLPPADHIAFPTV